MEEFTRQRDSYINKLEKKAALFTNVDSWTEESEMTKIPSLMKNIIPRFVLLTITVIKLICVFVGNERYKLHQKSKPCSDN